MKKFKLMILAVFTILSCSTALLADGNSNVWEEWRRGYDIFQKADKELAKGNMREALQLYRESRDLYLKVQKERPDWNQTIIKRRLELCEEQINKITAKLSSSQSSSKQNLPNNVVIVPKEQDKRTDLSNNEYRQKYFELLIEVENLRKQLRNKSVSNRNFETLVKEKQTLEDNYKALQRRYQELKDNSSGGGSEEFESIQKLLIAEKMKSENLSKKLKIVSDELNKAQNKNKGNESDLQALNKEKERHVKSIEALQSELNKSIELNSKRSQEIKDLKAIISKNLTTIDEWEAASAKDKAEITKLNRWIEDLQSKQNNAMHEKVLAENRQLKLLNEEMGKKHSELNSKYNDTAEKAKKLELNNKDYANTIALLERREKATVQELNNLREQYLLQQKTIDSNKEAYEKLKAENKKNYDNLNILIAKNEELNLKLNNKASSEELTHKENRKIREDFESQKKQFAMNIEALQLNVQNLEKENRELIAENNSLKTKKADNSQKFVMNDNQELEKIKAEYKALKEKYEFLSMEIESLSKPVTEVAEKTVNSDDELKTFLKNTAEEALSAGDLNSACWYFEELKKLDNSAEYQTYYLLFKAASDNQSINSVKSEMKSLPDSAEKQLLANFVSKSDLNKNLNGKKPLNKKLFDLAKSKIAEIK